MTTTRTFTLGEVLSIITGKLLCEIGGVYCVLNFLTGEDLYTHQIPRAMLVCQPFVAGLHPDLAALDWSDVTTANWRAWLAEQVARFGPTRALEALPRSAYEAQDPLDELIEMRHGDPSGIIVLRTDES